MATIKSYTDLEQSKKLAEILPLDSADYTRLGKDKDNTLTRPYFESCSSVLKAWIGKDKMSPCWSLAALLGVLPNYQLQTQDDGIGVLCSCNGKFNIVTANNPIDACYEMIIKLNELNLL